MSSLAEKASSRHQAVTENFAFPAPDHPDFLMFL
jgi:hypothetical protein